MDDVFMSNDNDDRIDSLDCFIDKIQSTDTTTRLNCYLKLEQYLNNENISIYSGEQFKTFIESLTHWINSSNFKICLNALNIIRLLMNRIPDELKVFMSEIITTLIDRLADSKEQVRDSVKCLLINFMEYYTPAIIWDKLVSGFGHKLCKVKEELLLLVDETLYRFGANSLQLNKIVTYVVKLLTTDSNQIIRDRSFDTLIEIYKYVGDKLKIDLKKKQLPEAKLKLLFQKFDDVYKNGLMKVDDFKPQQQTSNKSDQLDSTTCSLPPTSKKMTSTNQTSTTAKSSTSRQNSASSASASSKIPRSSSAHRNVVRSRDNKLSIYNDNSSTTASGNIGVDENLFMESFENVPKVQIYSSKEVDQHMSQVNECLADVNHDWEKRVDALRKIRSLAICCKNQYEEEFFASLKMLYASMTSQIKDLRSQIVREACITVAYLSQLFKNRFELFAEIIFNHLLNLIQSSAKVIATSGIVAIRFIIENTHSSRLTPIIINAQQTSKSKEIRRFSCEAINQVLTVWETHHLEKHLTLLQTAIKKGIADADQEARLFGRKAFWSFYQHFPQAANKLLDSFDAKTQKLLQSGSNGTFGSMKSLKDANFHDTTDHKSKITSTQNAASASAASPKLTRSTSAVDLKNARSQSVKSPNDETSVSLAASAVPVITINYFDDEFDISSAEITEPTTATTSTATCRIPLLDSASRTNTTNSNSSRIPISGNNQLTTPKPTPSMTSSRIIQSQPGSRSTSPTPKTSYITHTAKVPLLNSSGSNNGGSGGGSAGMTSSTPRSKIPTSSRNSSRESSPGRRSSYGERRTATNVVNKTPNGRRLFSRQLPNNSDGEHAFATAVNNKHTRINRKWDMDSDEASETSSLCSERSYSSSIGGTRVAEVREFGDIITYLSSQQWSERRDGVVTLMNMIQGGRVFNRQEIKRLTDIFTRMFQDPHGKVFALYLDTLNEFIKTYKRDLQEWIYILLTRLLTKLGSENLQSVYQKLCRCLESVRSSFDLDLQFSILIQFINDPTQSPNLKVKVAILKYLQDIICLMEPVDFHTTNELKCAISKIIAFTSEPKSVDIRKTAQAVLVALFNLNTPEFSMLLSELPRKLQEPATRILQNHIKTFSQENSNVGEYKAKTTNFSDYFTSSQLMKDIQNLNLSEKHDLYGLGSSGVNRTDSNSKDSGIQSNIDLDNGENLLGTNGNTNQIINSNINLIIESITNYSSNKDQLIRSLDDLTVFIKSGGGGSSKSDTKWIENFNNILLCLFEHVNSSDNGVQISALTALRELLQYKSNEFVNYTELTIIKLIEQYKDQANDLTKIVEDVVYTAAKCLPTEACIRVLKPLIETADYPKNLIAIRMLQKTLESTDAELCKKLLADILSALLIAWDSSHSPVRKAAVFCLVGVYMIVGDDLRAHLTNLSSSKLKLLNVYINRAKEQNGI